MRIDFNLQNILFNSSRRPSNLFSSPLVIWNRIIRYSFTLVSVAVVYLWTTRSFKDFERQLSRSVGELSAYYSYSSMKRRLG